MHTFAHRIKSAERAGVSEEQIVVLGGWHDHQTMVRSGRSAAVVRATDAGAKVLPTVGVLMISVFAWGSAAV